jgi:hypothetical protein
MPVSDEMGNTIPDGRRGSETLSRCDIYLIIAGISLELGLVIFWLLSGVWRGSGWLIPAYFLPTFFFFVCIFILFGRSSRDPPTAFTRWIILGFAALFHFTMLLTPQPLSNDIYRYMWDGKILANGINPYTYAPAADELVLLRDSNWELIFNRDIPTGYPPLTELLFAANHLLNLGEIGIRLLSVVGSMGVCVVLMKILGHLGKDERKVILYAWSPLVALEFGNSGHFDAIAILALSLAFLMHAKRNPAGTAFFLALGGVLKFFPALLAPFWGRRWGLKPWSVFVLIFVLPWIPFVSGGTPFTGLRVFASRGDFNASLSSIIQVAWGIILQPDKAQLVARITTLLTLAFIGIILARWIWHSYDLRFDWTFAMLLMGWSLLLSPVVHPWYICWMLSFITIEWEVSWMVLSGSIIFARHVYLGFEANGIWREAGWTRWAVYLPFYLTYFVQRLRHSHRGKSIAGFIRRPVFFRMNSNQ